MRGALDRGAGQEARADELALALVRRRMRERDAERGGLLYGVGRGELMNSMIGTCGLADEGGGPATSGGESRTPRRVCRRLAVGSGKSYCLLHERRRRRPQARLRRQAQALHLHRRARGAARVDPQLRDQGARSPTPRSGRRRPSPTGSSRAWASSASWGSTSPRSTAGRAATTTRASCWPRRSSTRTRAAWRWAWRCRPTWRCRRSSPSAPRSRSASGSCPAIARREDPLPRDHRARRGLRRGRRSRRAPCATATSTSSTARRPTSPTATART